MSNNFITKISPSVRIVALFLLILCLLLAKSIYLILFITILTIILIIIIDEKVNIYVNMLKKIMILLLILLVAYIIIFREYNIVTIAVFLYKLVIGFVLIRIFLLTTKFGDIHEGLYGLLYPLKKFNIDIEKFSLEVVLSIYFMKFLIESKEKIQIAQVMRGKKKFNLKNKVFPMVIYSINQLENLQNNLKIKLYKLNYKKVNVRSKIIFVLILTLFIICLFKEVIL